jgi:hypothetical protein
MSGQSIRFGLAATALLVVGMALAADPPPGEELPPPRVLQPAPEEMPGIPVHPSVYYRVSRYDVWNYVEVDRTGHFRPLVVYSPYGSYYLYNGAPFPWVTTHQHEITPKVMGTPYRSHMPYIDD